MSFIVYTDGACSGNGTPSASGGWGAVLIGVDGSRTELNNPEPIKGVTNNAMEIMAVIEALKHIEENHGSTSVEIRTDSRLVIGWMADGWKRNSNQELLAELDTLVAKHDVIFTKVKGHSGDPMNELADRLAVKGSGQV